MNISTEEFNSRLYLKCTEMKVSQILKLPGVYEAVSEHLNNEIIHEWEADQETPDPTDI